MRFRSSSLAVAALLLTTASPSLAGPDSAHHGRGTAGIFWFLHISDSHIGTSFIEGPNATPHFEFALNDAVSAIDPVFVTNTGDLVDGSAGMIPTAGQEQAEWDEYRGVVDDAGMTVDFYFDLPGNHDGYNDIGMTYYLANSLQGQHNGTHYADWVVDTPVGEYYFFGFNSNGNGSRQGWFDPNGDPLFTSDELAAFETGLQTHSAAHVVFTLGHHPLSMVTDSGQVVDQLTNIGGGYYLHGHDHAYDEYLAGNQVIVVNQADTLGKGNIDNLAVGVVDHHGFAYRAMNVVSPWPFVLISTPMSRTVRGSSTEHPYAYDICLDRPDNPFRAVVFSPDPPTEVTVEVGTVALTSMQLVSGSGSLYQAEVDTSSLGPGPHDVTVTAVVGSDIGQHVISAIFAPGPCEELPNSDEGLGGGGGGGGGGAGGGGTGAAGGAGGGTGGVGGDGGVPPAANPSADDEGGCGCRVLGPSSTRTGVPPWLVGWILVAAAGWGRRRRDRHSS